MMNSIILGIMDYENLEKDIWQNRLAQKTENIFTIIFTIEALFKILAMGFFIGKGTYLRNLWNWLDFIVVVTSLLQFLPSMRNISGLRVFRLFRPLRNLTTVPSMRTLVGTLLQSMSQLSGILSLAIFFFLIFAILGVSLWTGKIHQRCWQLEQNPDTLEWINNWNTDLTSPALCRSDKNCGQNQVCDSYLKYLKDRNQNLEDGYWDRYEESLNWGITNFDNMPSAFLTIFQCITMEGWTSIMYIYMDAYN